jgi:hypothetical protein
MNLYNVYFVSKGTGPQTVQIEAQNSAGVKAQVESRYPGAYNNIFYLLNYYEFQFRRRLSFR